MGANPTAPNFKPWITRIDPNCGLNKVTERNVLQPRQVDGISIIGFLMSRGAAGVRSFAILELHQYPRVDRQRFRIGALLEVTRAPTKPF
jgi:hypothetical protein